MRRWSLVNMSIRPVYALTFIPRLLIPRQLSIFHRCVSYCILAHLSLCSFSQNLWNFYNRMIIASILLLNPLHEFLLMLSELGVPHDLHVLEHHPITRLVLLSVPFNAHVDYVLPYFRIVTHCVYALELLH